ncbi:MAG TPA: cytochrome c oxidase subunit 3 [Thermoanaerobaculia bacterium]
MSEQALDARTPRAVIDVAELPDHAFGSRSLMWWATLLIIFIEATVFVVAIASYFYLQGSEVDWPPPDTQPPDLYWATINTVILLLSLVPNQLYKSAAEKLNTHGVRLWLVVADIFAFVFMIIRFIEFRHLNVSWDSNAYGSITWTLLGFHAFHVVTDVLDSGVLTALIFTHHGYEPKRLVDAAENGFYWYFVVLSWLPIYFVLYWAPRVL